MIDDRMVGDVLNLRIEPTHSAVSRLHRQAQHFLDRLGVSASLAADVELVVAELASNAVDHAPGHPVELELLLSDDAVHLTVTNYRPDQRVHVPPSGASADHLTDRGRGLAIVYTLVDGMWVHGQIDSTSVTCLLKRERDGLDE